MKAPDLSPKQLDAVRASFEYWLRNWDWEMPTLTGLSREEFERVAGLWPTAVPENVQTTMLAALGAVREFWAAERSAAQLLGLTEGEMVSLIDGLTKGVDDAV
ncbi:MAG: hypothetical protein ACK5X3_15010 [Pseudomonadota bacterium]|jgi:hypothetical protein